MKIYLIFLFVFFVITVKAQTYKYHPFPDSSASWNFQYILYCDEGKSNELYSIIISGDTIIQSQTYHKLDIPYIESNNSGICDHKLIGYQGAFRQDKENRKVYFIRPSETFEQLLYDFTWQVGDTVKGVLASLYSDPDIIKSIDSVQVGDTYRKRWIINSCYNINLIEGIGSTYGLIIPSPGCVTDLWDYSITCFQQNRESLYPNNSLNCELITSSGLRNNISDQVKVYPNPSNGLITIEFNEEGSYSILLVDILGNILLAKEINKQQKTEICNTPFGMYFLRIIDKDKNIQTIKIISCP